MGSRSKYAVINTKIKYLQGKMLSEKQYSELIQADNYSTAIEYLKAKTSYSDIFREYDINNLHRGFLEVILKRNYINNFNKLYHYFNGDYKKLFQLLFIKYEIEDLKTILRGKYVNKSEERIRKLLVYQSPLNSINYDYIIKSKNIKELVDKLKGSIYYKHLYPLVKTVDKDGLFRMEMTLDFIYFSSIRKFIRRINEEDRKIIYEFNGVMSDLLNLQWIYRGIKYYNLKSEILLNYTILDGAKIKKEMLKKLCYSRNLDEFFSLVSKLPYKNIYKNIQEEDSSMEKETLVYLKNLLIKYKIQNKNNISSLLSYLQLSLIEVRDIISIVENKRYRLDDEVTMKYITVTI